MYLRVAFIIVVSVVVSAAVAHAQWTWTPQTGRFVNIKRMPKETPELQLEYARSLMMSGDYRRAFKETEKFVEFYGNDQLADENQFLRGEIELAQGKGLDAAKSFQQLIAAFPDSKRYEEAIRKQYEIGDYYYARGEQLADKKWRLFKKRPYKQAAEVYAMVVDNQPFSPIAAEAQYKIGLCHYARKQYVDAAFEYRRVIEDYPSTEWVNDASFGLAMCHYKAALPPAYDQTQSELAIEAIDDFATRYPTDARVEDLKQKREEMRESIAMQQLETARFYERRREFPSAKLYYEMLALEYADTTSGAIAKEWLEQNSGVTHVGDKYMN